MKEELELQKETKSPFQTGLVTFISFILLGFIPLIVYVADYSSGGLHIDLFSSSSVLIFFCKKEHFLFCLVVADINTDSSLLSQLFITFGRICLL